MGAIEDFFLDLDRRWKQPRTELLPLRVIGCAALMLQTKYERRTKDSDIIETELITETVRKALLEIAGKDTNIHVRHGMYIDIVASGLPFLPHPPTYHEVKRLKDLKNFTVVALDAADVVVTKLMRFNANDADDIHAMARMGRVSHKAVVERFRSAVEAFSLDARADELPKTIDNLHSVERDYFQAAETPIDLPEWMDEP